ncbi:MAG: hypothetical protein PHN22_01035, partial [Candidatus ainarchaeum sp.]|nr:hypothetical protein [Candidatus ainarchaeum sp.]
SEWLEYSEGGITSYDILTNLNSLSYKDVFLINKNYDTSDGIGVFYSDRGDNMGDRAFLVGGYWSIGSYAGVLSRHLNTGPSSRYSYFGFRCVVVP